MFINKISFVAERDKNPFWESACFRLSHSVPLKSGLISWSWRSPWPFPCFTRPAGPKKILPEKARDFGNMLLVMYLSALVGFRLFYVAFVLPDYFLTHPLEIFKVWKGGFVAYGGLFLPVAVFMVWVRWKKMPALLTADILAPAIVLVFVVARIACFLNGCCFGKPTQSIFSVVFPLGSVAHRFYPGMSLYPTQLYLIVSALAVYGV
ncbi:MAG: prolipoprotein diacylglyceryl transferase, partial [Thermodesulfobacteriota bacterium]|nr:prolipoprotein diacylglyceryl transferase [Thermodesulfobacteriota bacterium]